MLKSRQLRDVTIVLNECDMICSTQISFVNYMRLKHGVHESHYLFVKSNFWFWFTIYGFRQWWRHRPRHVGTQTGFQRAISQPIEIVALREGVMLHVIRKGYIHGKTWWKKTRWSTLPRRMKKWSELLRSISTFMIMMGMTVLCDFCFRLWDVMKDLKGNTRVWRTCFVSYIVW